MYEGFWFCLIVLLMLEFDDEILEDNDGFWVLGLVVVLRMLL